MSIQVQLTTNTSNGIGQLLFGINKEVYLLKDLEPVHNNANLIQIVIETSRDP